MVAQRIGKRLGLDEAGVEENELIGGTALTGGEVVTSIELFTLVGASTVAVPVVAYLAAPARMTPRLHQLHEWLVRYNVTVTIVVIIVVGVALMGKGIGDL